MPRPRKYSEALLTKLTHDAIQELTNNGQFLRRVTVADVCRYGQRIYPEMIRQNIQEVVEKILKDYEEEVNELYGYSLKDFNGAIDFWETFNYQEFLRKNKNNLEAALQELGRGINRILRHNYLITRELNKTNSLLACDEEAQIKEYQETINGLKEYIKELNEENKRLKGSLREYITFYKKLNTLAGYEVVKRERMAKVSIPYDPELDIPEEIARLQEEMEQDKILFFESMKKGKDEQE